MQKAKRMIFEILKEVKAGQPIAPRLYVLLVLMDKILADKLREVRKGIPKERVLNKDNPQYVLGWNACRQQFLLDTEITKLEGE